jgi:hypothetical protein
MSFGFMQPDVSRVGKESPVWKDKSPQGTSVLFRHALQVNTDGTRRSYSVEDFWGETKAINNLCNAMSDVCSGLTQTGLRNRRIVTPDAMAKQWPIAQVKATRIDPAIIPFKDARLCTEVNGYLVSATALHAAAIGDVGDQDAYLDAATVPALVLPRGIRPALGRPRAPTGFDLANAKIGDLVVAISPFSAAPVYGVVADAAVLIFAGTRDAKTPYLMDDRIDHDAAEKFVEWGGGSLEHAMARLTACSIDIGKRGKQKVRPSMASFSFRRTLNLIVP